MNGHTLIGGNSVRPTAYPAPCDFMQPNKPAKRFTKEFGIVYDETSGLSQVDEIRDLRTLK